MPVFLASLLGGLISIAGTLVGRVLIALGVSVVTFTGVNSSLTFLKNQAIQSFSALPASVVGMISLMKVGISISIVLSAMVARLAINGLSGDTLKKWVLK